MITRESYVQIAMIKLWGGGDNCVCVCVCVCARKFFKILMASDKTIPKALEFMKLYRPKQNPLEKLFLSLFNTKTNLFFGFNTNL